MQTVCSFRCTMLFLSLRVYMQWPCSLHLAKFCSNVTSSRKSSLIHQAEINALSLFSLKSHASIIFPLSIYISTLCVDVQAFKKF